MSQARSIRTQSTRAMKGLAVASLAVNMGIVVTGGVVRLTGSGLGCPTWPECTGNSLVPHQALGIHGVIEFGNRTLTFVLAAVAIATFVIAWRTKDRRLWGPALLLGLGIPGQAVVGGISVLTHLNPWIVGLHMLLSLAMIQVAVLLVRRSYGVSAHGATHPLLGWAALAAGWTVLYVGTIVTGAGPNSGSADSPRNGLNLDRMAQLHADVVFLLVGLTLAWLLVRPRPQADLRRATTFLFATLVVQAAIGFAQYFNGNPGILVGFHLVGSTAVAATLSWLFLASTAHD
jgi:cytochrome c oxidase assembly protein subunit 15